jgi:protein SCO1
MLASIIKTLVNAFSPILAMLLILLLFALLSCEQEKVETLPFYNTPDFTPLWLSEQEANAQKIHTIAPFSFINNQTLMGKIYVANFFFTACGSVCPNITNNLIAVQDTFKNEKDIRLISHSVTPWADSVSQLRAYAQRYKINAQQWHLLTGKKAEIYQLARQSYFAEEEIGYTKDSTEFLHTEHALLIDRKGRIRGIYNATLPLEIQKIITDIRVLKK